MIVRRLVVVMCMAMTLAACDSRPGLTLGKLNGREFEVASYEGYPWPDQAASDRPLRLVFVDGWMSMKGICEVQFSAATLHDQTLTMDAGHAQHVGGACEGHAAEVEAWQAALYAVPMQLELDGRSLTVTATVDGKRVVISLEEVAFVGIS